MKKILILLSFIYFVSCGTEYCNSIQQAENSENCLSAEVQDQNNNCCYLQIGLGTQGVAKLCYEFTKAATLEKIKADLTAQYQAEGKTLEDVICPADQGYSKGSYLKTGILLLAAFLL